MRAYLLGEPSQLLRTLIVGVLVYAGFVAVQRVTGRRSLSKMNGFDFIVTVALGSIVANALMNPEAAALEAVLAIGVLLALQWVITSLSVRSARVRRLVKNDPVVLVRDGQILQDELKRARVTESELFQALRQAGLADLSRVGAVVLETDGGMSVISAEAGTGVALDNLSP